MLADFFFQLFDGDICKEGITFVSKMIIFLTRNTALLSTLFSLDVQ